MRGARRPCFPIKDGTGVAAIVDWLVLQLRSILIVIRLDARPSRPMI